MSEKLTQIGKTIFKTDDLIAITELEKDKLPYYRFLLSHGHNFEIRSAMDGIEEAKRLWQEWQDKVNKSLEVPKQTKETFRLR